ncbi:transposase [candidate division KSB1 bacterium]|nr:transposase [candidate division KSB1 bacterium]
MSRKIKFYKDGYYHLYNRGANRMKIFKSTGNYYFLLKRMAKYIPRFKISMIAYCLMPNHYHFLIRQNSDLDIGKFMQSVFNSYVKAFNNLYGRTGTLFEGPFKNIHVNKEEYLVHLCRYIHRNPIDGKKPLVKDIREWPFSNYLEWIDERAGQLVEREFIQGIMPKPYMYEQFVLNYVPPKKFDDGLRWYLFDE